MTKHFIGKIRNKCKNFMVYLKIYARKCFNIICMETIYSKGKHGHVAFNFFGLTLQLQQLL